MQYPLEILKVVEKQIIENFTKDICLVNSFVYMNNHSVMELLNAHFTQSHQYLKFLHFIYDMGMALSPTYFRVYIVYVSYFLDQLNPISSNAAEQFPLQKLTLLKVASNPFCLLIAFIILYRSKHQYLVDTKQRLLKLVAHGLNRKTYSISLRIKLLMK